MRSPPPSPPRPVIDDLSRPFWDGATQGKLVIQQCQACHHLNHPPFVECTRCRSSDLDFTTVSGRGVVYQRAIVESPITLGFTDLPYACLMVELVEQKRLLIAGNLVGADPYEATIGRPVQVVFQVQPDGFTLPQFQLSSDNESA